MKLCAHCKFWLPRSMFSRNRRNNDWLHYDCRRCKARLEKEHRARRSRWQLEAANAYKRRWRAEQREKAA